MGFFSESHEFAWFASSYSALLCMSLNSVFSLKPLPLAQVSPPETQVEISAGAASLQVLQWPFLLPSPSLSYMYGRPLAWLTHLSLFEFYINVSLLALVSICSDNLSSSFLIPISFCVQSAARPTWHVLPFLNYTVFKLQCIPLVLF